MYPTININSCERKITFSDKSKKVLDHSVYKYIRGLITQEELRKIETEILKKETEYIMSLEDCHAT